MSCSLLETNNYEMFGSCWELETFYLRRLTKSLKLDQSPNISYDSLRYLVDNATTMSASSTAITVTVRPSVYAKLTGDTTNSTAAALTEDELTKWQAIATDAAKINIAFAASSRYSG
jgi:hypothetical protein